MITQSWSEFQLYTFVVQKKLLQHYTHIWIPALYDITRGVFEHSVESLARKRRYRCTFLIED